MDPFWGSFDQLDLQGLLEAAQALAQSGLTQSEFVGRASKVPMLGDNREVLDVAQFHVDNQK